MLTNTAPEKDLMESAVEWSKLQNRNGDAYIPNTDKPYSGWAKQIYDNEQVKVLAEFTDGSVTRLKQWQKNGIPRWDFRYSIGKVAPRDVRQMIGGIQIPLFKMGHRLCGTIMGRKEFEGNFKDGKEDGLSTWWYENGQKQGEGNSKDGKDHGLTTRW